MVHALRRLTLVRHGETDWNRERRFQGRADEPLNETGRAQSRALAARLRSRKFDALATSTLVRASETASIVGAELGLVPEPVADLCELDVGCWGGLTFDEVRTKWPTDLARALAGEEIAYGGGETRAAAHARFTAAMDALASRHAGASVLVVSHGLALKTFVAGLLGMDLRHADRLASGGNTAVTEFEFHGGAPRLVVFADASHLAGAPSDAAVRDVR